jgi:hypothetical protein
MKVTQNWNSKGDASRFGPSRILKFHITTEDTLYHSILEQGLENIRLKRTISELDNKSIPKPLFVEPLAIILY